MNPSAAQALHDFGAERLESCLPGKDLEVLVASS